MSKVNPFASEQPAEKRPKPEKQPRQPRQPRPKLTREEKRLKYRRTRAGSYSVIITLVAVAAAIAINLLASALPSNYTKFDTTSDALYSISQQTKQIVSGLTEDVTVYLVANTGDENTNVSALLDKYAAAGPKLKVVYKDPTLYPKFVQQYTDEEVESNSVIVVCGERSKVVPYGDIVVATVTGVDYTTYQYTYSYSFNGEQEITGAINYVTSDDLPVIYNLTGHGESELSDSLKKSVAKENVDLKDISIVGSGIPEDCSCLFINSPKSDISEYEVETIMEYLDGGGRLIAMTDFTGEAMPNLESVLADYGLSMNQGYVVEGDKSCYYSLPYYLLPDIGSHDITQPIIDGRYSLLFPIAQGMEKLDAVRSGVTITPLLSTSDKAFIKTDTNTQEKAEGDKTGSFIIAAAITETNGDAETRIVWFSTSNFVADKVDAMVSGANSDLLLNSVGWTCERENSISIRSKSLDTQKLVIDEENVSRMKIVIIFVIPLAVLAVGVGVWLKRRAR